MNAEELLEEGTTAISLGDYATAVDFFKKAAELEPANFDAWHSLGMAYMKLQKYPEAIEAGKKTVELRPNDQFARVSVSMFFQRNGQIPEAEAEATKAKIIGWGGKVAPSAPGEKVQL